MIAPFHEKAKSMRVSTAGSGDSQERMFTVVVLGLQSGRQRRAERRFTVGFSQLQATVQRITSSGGKITAMIPADAADSIIPCAKSD